MRRPGTQSKLANKFRQKSGKMAIVPVNFDLDVAYVTKQYYIYMDSGNFSMSGPEGGWDFWFWIFVEVEGWLVVKCHEGIFR